MRRVTGWVLAILSGLIILYNVTQTRYNRQQIEDHPWITFFSGGENLERAYTFTPPFTGFEIAVIAILIIGAIMIFLPTPQQPSAVDKPQDEH
ncbi:MAG: hypothetical protein H6822_18605 [Planctomycetaceae bacterium]|nr:hypothetical protein [Planctomycetales bacterium]MCB9924199.1 hypothetical protein [Planctomycetaceae bacterium]